jgi:hypothetical protein
MANRKPSIGTMSPEEFRAALAKLSLTQAQVALLFGYSERTVCWWVVPEGTGPAEPVAMWVRFMLCVPEWSPAAVAAVLERCHPEAYGGLSAALRGAQAKQSRRQPEPA